MEFDMHSSRTMKHATAARAGSLKAISALCGAAAAVGGAVDPVLASGKASAGSSSAQCSVDKLDGPNRDRKSTRLNSSHVAISYAVFCLKKKIQDQIHPYR